MNLVKSLNPNLFLYLGDVYESGSVTEFYNWYGDGSNYFSSLRAITDPTIGNHEYGAGPGAPAILIIGTTSPTITASTPAAGILSA